MNGAFVHIAVNHVPVIGFPACFLLFLTGAIRKSKDLVQAGFVGVILVVLSAIVALKSGGPAAGVVHSFPGVNVHGIHAHAQAAETAVIIGAVLAAVSLLGWWLSMRPEGAPMPLILVMVVGTLAASVWLGYVAHLGGLIRHPEIENGATPQEQAAPESETGQ